MSSGRLTHLPAGLGWSAEPAETPRPARASAELAAHWSAPFEPIESPVGQLAAHWMKPFEPPGLPAPIRPATGLVSGAREPSRRRITGPGGMDTLQDVTPGPSCCCASTGCNGGDGHHDLTRPAIGVAPFVCPAGFTIQWDEYGVTVDDLDCIHAAIRFADAHLVPLPVYDCCDPSTWDNPDGDNENWLSLFLRELARCPPSVGVAAFLFGDHGGSLYAREAMRGFLLKNYGIECYGCIDAACPRHVGSRWYVWDYVDQLPRVCLSGASNRPVPGHPDGLREGKIRVPTCTLKDRAPRGLGPLPTPPRPRGPAVP